ncbi:chorismate--pyruvate lyase family protein [Pseudomonas sp. TTU2014-080ASC]|uniref:chorismate--pyruvate lyase family protein n=1 Tax=Pseudomonas sp. TTU2014-080ASC TaxID=1729724 RepID=UPI0007188A0D|nr:chorismate lyase [Pseudomonas sp. TTU2014-080ASC]KRW61232.1 chorismate--pyruvate lyase [Pseudomonas sp. TTU2014-080ASC]
MSNHPVSATPSWLSCTELQQKPDPTVYDWLFNEDSLTRRLTRQTGGHFSVRPLQEGWQTLRADECSALGVAPGSEGWVREVYLLGHQRPWVFARSVAARQALESSDMAMDELGTRSLGELLFSNPAFDRGVLQVCRYPSQWLPAEARTNNLWGRRSCFTRAALGVLVAEVFLPQFWLELGHDPAN